MKRSFFLHSLLVSLAVLLFTGCGTVAPSEKKLKQKCKAVTWIATTKILQDHPEWKPQFLVAKSDLEIIMNAQEISLVEVLEVVRRLPVKEFKSGDGALLITGTMLFFEDELGQVAIDNPTWLRAAVAGMVEGMTLAGVTSS